MRSFYFFFSFGLTIVMGLGKATGVTTIVPNRISSLTLTLLARCFTPCSNPGCALNYDKEATGGTLDEGAVVAVMNCSCAGLAISFGGLLLTMKRDYIPTFVSMKTSSKYIQEYFTGENIKDKQKFELFMNNESKRRGLLEDEVKA